MEYIDNIRFGIEVRYDLYNKNNARLSYSIVRGTLHIMPQVEAQLNGMHPRSEALIELTRSYDRNKATWEQVSSHLARETRELVSLQEDMGARTITDGAIGWKDQLRPVVECMNGLAPKTRYSRWYDTNTFYQKPTVNDQLSVDRFDSDRFVNIELLPKNRAWKITLPGPYTLTELSEDKYYNSKAKLLEAYAESLRRIIVKLASAGVKQILLTEPSLVYWPYREEPPSRAELETGIDATRTIIEQLPDIGLGVSTFFGDASPIIDRLLELPLNSVGIDLYETDWNSLPEIQEKLQLILGIVDSEESAIESPEWIANITLKIQRQTRASNIVLAPNTDLKFVPRTIADQKLASLGKAVSLVHREEFS